MRTQFIAAAENWLAANASMSPLQRSRLAGLIPLLLDTLPDQTPFVIGLSGPPGTGKSTIAGACCAALQSNNVSSLVVSLDDYYLPAVQRERLAQTEHPLFRVRGVPGTHELDLLKSQVLALCDPGHTEILMPRFDKSIDDRLPEPEVLPAGFRPQVIVIEGWMIGVPPQDQRALRASVNALESEHDPDGDWRLRVNNYLRHYFNALDPLLDGRWTLLAPDWNTVIDWRWQQEREGGPGLLASRAGIGKFLDHYQRLCQHMQESASHWADAIIQLDKNHLPANVSAQ